MYINPSSYIMNVHFRCDVEIQRNTEELQVGSLPISYTLQKNNGLLSNLKTT